MLDVDHADYARTCCIEIPGPETDEIGKLEDRDYDEKELAMALAGLPAVAA